MRLVLDTSKVSFTVSKASEPKMNGTTKTQRTQRDTGKPEWVVEVFAMDPSGGEVIRVTVAGEQPRVAQGQPVRLEGLEAIAWTSARGSGVAYRADSIMLVSQSKAA